MVIPTDEPSRAGLTITRGSPHDSAKAGDLVEDAPAGVRPAGGRDFDPLHYRDPQAADEPLVEGLVHAHRGSGHARARIGEVVGLEQRLDGAVLAERAVERGKDDRGDGPRAGGPRA